MQSANLERVKKAGNWISAFLLGNTRELIARIDERTEHIVKDLDDIRPKVNEMYPKVDLLWKDRSAPTSSPRQLNDFGKKILEGSGVKQVIDAKRDELLEIVRTKNTTNAYDAEQAIFEAVNAIQKTSPDLIEKLKEGAFRVGADIPTVLFVGGIYLRNQIFGDLGFSLGDIDEAAGMTK